MCGFPRTASRGGAAAAALIAAGTLKNKEMSRRLTRPQMAPPGPSHPSARGPGLAKCRFERCHAGFQRFVLLAGDTSHVFYRLEILPADNIELAQYSLRLAAKKRLNLAPDPLRGPGGVVHQPRNLVKETIRRLHHGLLRNALTEHRLLCFQTMAMVRRSRKGAAQ